MADMSASMLLVNFYAMEMEKALGWSIEKRFMNLQKAQTMIQQGLSKMLIAENEQRMPVGMIVCTETDNPKVLRMEAISVAEPFRAKGVAKKLMDAAGAGKEFHAYATPQSLSWYKHNGFRVVGNHKEGTIEVTTAKDDPEYNFKIKAPLMTEIDVEIIKHLKNLESSK